MPRGKTFSITVPERMVEYYDRKAQELGVSRSKIVLTILLNDFQSHNPETKEMKLNCKYIQGDYCHRYEDDCGVDVNDPHSCDSYTPKE